MIRPLTWIIQAIGFSSIWLGNVHSGSKLRIFSIVRIAFDFPWPVLSATPNALSMAVSFRCGWWLLSSRKLTQPIVRTIPQAQVSGLPRVSGEGRLRARTPASFRHKAPYSSLRCSPAEGVGQGHDPRRAPARAAARVVEPPPVGPALVARFFVAAFRAAGCGSPATGGSDVTMPSTALACL